MSSVARAIKQVLRSPPVGSGLYHLGALEAYHRVRNRRALTVVMFHRVLSARDPRFAYCDPGYSMSTDLFAECLRFFVRHYRVIALEQLLVPRPRLPDWPLLITFDDGWRDNAEQAMPLLSDAGLPATLFAASDAIDAAQPVAFWQVQMIHAFRRRRLTADRCAQLWRETGGDPATAPPFTTIDCCRQLIARLEGHDERRLAALLAALAPVLDSDPDERHLLSASELRGMARSGFSIGGHGKTHRPLARCRDAGRELAESRRALARALGVPIERAPLTLSFPHGSYNAEVVGQARAAGYRALFTSDAVLTPLPRGAATPFLIGRLAFESADITDEAGRFRPERLALRLFRARHALLAMPDAPRLLAQTPEQRAAGTG